MNDRNRLSEALVGGGTGLLVVASYIVLRSLADGAGPGDWLNFAGVIFGVALTIAGTLIVTAIAKALSEKEKRAQFIRAVKSLGYACQKASLLDRQELILHGQIMEQLWRGALVAISALPNERYDEIVSGNIFKDGMDRAIPDLQAGALQVSQGTMTLDTFREKARAAEALCQSVLKKWASAE